MEDSDIRMMERLIGEYYFGACSDLQMPSETASREFGYQNVGRGGMTRHLQIRDVEQMRLLLVQNKPSDVYCSNARYLLPTEDMARKDFQGADLIFDIDAKDLDLPCRSGHVLSRCGKCGKSGLGSTGCECRKESKIPLPCRQCMVMAGQETARLVEILVSDLGIERGSIEVYFSGNEGFHLHVRSPEYDALGSRERASIARYVSFTGVMPESMGVPRGNKVARLPDPAEEGWRGRLASALESRKSRVKKITSSNNKDRHSEFEELLKEMSAVVGARIDHNVTSDIHRIFRMPMTINGKSGMLKAKCDDPRSFDPYVGAVVLGKDEVEVEADCPARFELCGKKFGPYGGEKVSVPGYAAGYMILKGIASVTPKAT